LGKTGCCGMTGCAALWSLKDQRRKGKDVGRFVLPSVAREAGFSRSLFQEGFPVPVLFDGDLGKEHTPVLTLDHEQAVPAHSDFIDVVYAMKGSEDGDFVLQFR